MSFGKPGGNTTRRSARNVSILVLMDVVREDEIVKFVEKKKQNVSILVLMDVVREESPPHSGN